MSLLTAQMCRGVGEGVCGDRLLFFKGCTCFINRQNLVKSVIQLSCSCCCPETVCIRGILYTISATGTLLLFYYSNLTGSHGVSETKSYQRKMNINDSKSSLSQEG